MINGHRVIPWIPYGRERTVSILIKYLARDHQRGLVDEVLLYLNTDPGQEADLRYAYELERRYDWVRLIERPEECPRKRPKQLNTGYAYRHFTDPDAVYVRMDDDLVYVHDDFFTNLVSAKLAMRKSVLCAFPVIINNAVVSWHLQSQGRVPGAAEGWPKVGMPYCMDEVGWKSGDLAVRLHELLLAHVEADAVHELFMHHPITLAARQQFSVSCFATLGADYADYEPHGAIGVEEEYWHSVHRPSEAGLANVIIPDALVSHWSFHHQHRDLDASGLLDRYRKLAEEL